MLKNVIVPIVTIILVLFMFPVAITFLLDISYALNFWAIDGDFNYINTINEQTLRVSVAFTLGMIFVIFLAIVVAFLENLNRQERERGI